MAARVRGARIAQSPGVFARTPQQPVADEVVLPTTLLGPWQTTIVFTRCGIAAVTKGRQRHSPQRCAAAVAEGTEQALTTALLAQQHIELALRIFQERHRVGRHASGLQAAERVAVQRQAEHGGQGRSHWLAVGHCHAPHAIRPPID